MYAVAGGRSGNARVGALVFACFCIHATVLARSGHAAAILWACHIGDLLVAVGLIAQAPRVALIGFYWLLVGTPAWTLDLLRGGELVPTSILTHVGGLAGGLWLALRQRQRNPGVITGTWWRAFAALCVLLWITRIFTPPSENVNMAFDVWERWRAHLPSSFIACAALGLGAHALAFWFVEQRLRLGLDERHLDNPKESCA